MPDSQPGHHCPRGSPRCAVAWPYTPVRKISLKIFKLTFLIILCLNTSLMGLKDVLRGAFPFLAAALPLPPPLGTAAMGMLGKALGIDNPNEDSVSKAIAEAQVKDPEALEKLQQAENDFKLQMQKLGFDQTSKLEDLANQDRASARARQIAVKDVTPTVLAYGLVGGFIAMAYFVLFHKMSADSALAGAVVGYLSAKAEQVVTYYFGSSAGSAAKTEILAQQNGGSK